MKLSTKIILPIILISALLILLNGCFGVPADESPGYTPGTITGVIASPCCSTSDEPVSQTSGSPEYWCYYCQETWSLQDGVEVVLTYGEDEVATTTTNDKGEFTFTNVSPGKNYVVTAYCPDFEDNRPLVKDVALELIEGGSFDIKTTDLVSTSLGLVVDFLVVYTEWGPEDISLDEVLADRPSFPNFSDFKALVYEVRRVVENCELNLLTDDDVQEALCLAAEEISKLDIGCAPGFTPLPGPTPIPGECDGNTKPNITDVTLDGETIFDPIPDEIPLIVGTSYEFCVEATDTDNILPQDLIYSLTIGDDTFYSLNGSNCLTTSPQPEDVGTYEVTVNVFDGCETTTWGPVTVVVECNEPPEITSQPVITVCLGEDYTYQVTAIDHESDPLTYSLTTKPDGMNISTTGGLITWTPASEESYPVTVEVSDGCSSDTQEFTVEVVSCLDHLYVLEEEEPIEVCEGGCVNVTDEITVWAVYTDGRLDEDVTDLCTFSATTNSHFTFTAPEEICGDAIGLEEDNLTATYMGKSVQVDVEVVSCECLVTDLSMIIKEGGNDYEKIPHDPFDPTIKLYDIEEPQKASMFDLKVDSLGSSISYRYWRGSCAGNAWTPWSNAVNDTLIVEGLKICNNEVNTLEIKISCSNNISSTYVVNIVPRGN